MNDKIRNVFIFDFISGVALGLEFYFGEALEPEDTFAMSIDFFIVRLTYVRTKGNTYD